MITGRSLVRFAGPMALSSLGGVVVGLTDTVIIGHFSTDALAGVGLGASLYELPMNALLGALLAYRILSPRIAGRDTAARNIDGLNLTLRGLLPWITVAFVIAMTAAVALLAAGAGGSASTEAAGAYLVGRTPSLVAETISTALVITLVSWGQVRTPFVVFLLSSGTNLVLDYCLVYGPGPFPRLGPLGDGLASSIGAYAVIPWLWWLTRKHVRGALTAIPSEIVRSEFIGWGRLTLPAVGSAVIDYGGNVVFMVLLAVSSTAGVAAARIASNMHLLAFLVVSSLSSAALYLVGRERIDSSQLLAAPSSIRRKFIRLGCVAGLVLAGLAWPVATLTTPDPAVRGVAAVLLLTVALMTPVMSWAYANVTVLRAAKRTGSDFASNALSVWAAQVPVAAVGILLAGSPGAFAGLVAYWICRALVTHRQVRTVAFEGDNNDELVSR